MAAKKIKKMLLERDMKLKDLAVLMGITLSTLSSRMTRDNFNEKDLQRIAELLDFEYNVIFTDKKTGKVID